MLFMIYGVLSHIPKLAQTRSMREMQENDLWGKTFAKSFPHTPFSKIFILFYDLWGALTYPQARADALVVGIAGERFIKKNPLRKGDCLN